MFQFFQHEDYHFVLKMLEHRVKALCRHELTSYIFSEICRCHLPQWGLSVSLWRVEFWTQSRLFWDSHETQLVNNSIRCNSIPGVEVSFCYKRWTVISGSSSHIRFTNHSSIASKIQLSFSTISYCSVLPSLSPFSSPLKPPCIQNYIFYFPCLSTAVSHCFLLYS